MAVEIKEKSREFFDRAFMDSDGHTREEAKKAYLFPKPLKYV